MVYTCPLISKSTSPFINPLITVLSSSIKLGIMVPFMFHSFFSSQVRSRYLSFFSPLFQFYPVISQKGKVLYSAGSLFFLLSITRSGCLAEIRWSVCVSKSQRILYISFSRMDSGLCIYHLFVWSNLNFLHNFESTFPLTHVKSYTLFASQVV